VPTWTAPALCISGAGVDPGGPMTERKCAMPISPFEVSATVLETIQYLQPHLEHWHEDIIPADGSLPTTFWFDVKFQDDAHRRTFVSGYIDQIREMIAPYRELPPWRRLVWALDQLPNRIYHLRSPRTEQERALVQKPGFGVTLGKGKQPTLLKTHLPIPKSRIEDLVTAASELYAILMQETGEAKKYTPEEWMPVGKAVERAQLEGYQTTITWLTRDAKKHGVQLRPKQLIGPHRKEVEWNSYIKALRTRANKNDGCDDQEAANNIREAHQHRAAQRSLD
jgi:hypothetical protein